MSKDTVGSMAELVDGRVVGDRELPISGVGDLQSAQPGEIGFVRETRSLELARKTRASALLVGEQMELDTAQIVVDDPDVAYARIALHFNPLPRAEVHRVHATADVDEAARLERPVEIGPMAVVGAGASIGPGTVVGAGTVIGADCAVGRDCVLHARVVLYPGTRIGDRVILHAGTVIGSDGFGYANKDSRWIKIAQLGRVVVEDDVEIGANSTVDCGTLGDTRIGRGTKIDNLVHIGHNCTIGEDNAVAGFCALAGSTVTGDRVVLAGHVITSGHMKIGDDVRIGGNSAVYRDVESPGDYMGYPVQKRPTWARSLYVLGHLVELNDRVRKLSRRG